MAVRLVEPAGVAEHRVHPGDLSGVPDVQRHRVDQPRLIAAGGEPAGMHPGAATDVEHPRRGGRQQPAQHILGAQELQPTSPAGQPVHLSASGVVTADRRDRLILNQLARGQQPHTRDIDSRSDEPGDALSATRSPRRCMRRPFPEMGPGKISPVSALTLGQVDGEGVAIQLRLRRRIVMPPIVPVGGQ
ncbi:hypothetical protein ACIA5D_49995 [Actinoplanes sp. NPDC051513]|uniref:hypothetical protein n=1 Tax=Actinoplanes sp. NPDC051513 TaxID=3363908 RepID=UPI00379C8C69